jgi:hypothetical protein
LFSATSRQRISDGRVLRSLLEIVELAQLRQLGE